jgi:O-antigen ligase
VGSAGPASFRNTDGVPKIAENYYLQLGQEVGVLGMALFIAINILVGVELWKLRTQTLSRILLASLVGITFINLVSHAWTDDTISYVWWGLAGIALSPVILKSRHKQDEQVHS